MDIKHVVPVLCWFTIMICSICLYFLVKEVPPGTTWTLELKATNRLTDVHKEPVK